MVTSKPHPLAELLQTALQAAFALVLVTLPIQKALLFPALSAGSSPFEAVALFPADLAVLFLLVVWGLKALNGAWSMSARGVLQRRISLWPRSAFGGEPGAQGWHKERPIFLAGLAFLALTLGSVLLAPWLYLGLAQWLHIALGVGLFAFVRSQWRTVKSFALPLVIGIASLEALVALGQFTLQHSLGLQILGEAVANPALAGVAKISLGSERIMRAYGTFSHPNVLAAFLGVSMLWLTGWYLSKRTQPITGELLFWITLPVLLAGLLVTFSRTAIVLTLLALLGLLAWQYWHGRPKDSSFKRKQLLGIAGIALIGVVGFVALFFPLVSQRATVDSADQSVALRVYYLRVAGSMVEHRPLLGVGAGNFVPALREWVGPKLLDWAYQPVHNLYALIAVESGVPALVSFLAIMGLVAWQWWRASLARTVPLRRAFLLAAVVLALAALLDHYAWTTSAGRYLWWLVLGVI